MFLGSYTSKGALGIYHLDQQLTLSAQIENPTYVTRKNNHLYALFGGENGCGMVVYQINDKELELIQRVSTNEQKGACYISVDDNEEIVVTTNYHEHCFHVFKKENGKFNEPIKVELEVGARCHYSYYSNQSQLLYITDLGCDRILIYDINDLTKPEKVLLFPEQTGVRHCVFSQDESTMFVLGEHSGEIFVYKYLKLISQVLSNPSHEFNESAAAIRLTSDEKQLIISVRNSNQIIVYDVNDGYLKENQRFSCGGIHPRDFNLVNDNTLVVANLNSNHVVYFKREDDEKPFIQSEVIEAPSITCVCI